MSLKPEETYPNRSSIGFKLTLLAVFSAASLGILFSYILTNKDAILRFENPVFIGFLGVFIVVAVVQVIIVFIIKTQIIKPLHLLAEMIHDVAGGRFTIGKLPVHNRDELGELGRAMNIMVSNLRDLVGELNETSFRTQNILNHTGQGFLTFSRNALIDDQFSTECERIFAMNINGLPFPYLIFPDHEDQRQFLYRIIIRILDETVDTKQKTYISLLPNEVKIRNKAIRLDYKIITLHDGKKQQFMVVLTDITLQRELEAKMLEERMMLKMVVKVITHMTDFIELINDYHFFIGVQLPSILNPANPIKSVINDLFRIVHTFKGNFSQLNLSHVAKELHNLETRISEQKADPSKQAWENVYQLFPMNEMIEWLEKDIRNLKSVLGDSFFEQQLGVRVDRSQLIELESMILRLCTPYEAKRLVSDVRKLLFRPFRDLLVNYIEYVHELSDRLQKPIHPLVIVGGEQPVDFEFYQSFAKSLIHLFRNALDHGIESAEERAALSKDELGSITCEITFRNDSITLKVSDDGRGIDPSQLRKSIAVRDIFTTDQMESLSDDEVLNHVFYDGVSTIKEITELSGRGVGLASLKHEVDKLGGNIQMTSNINEGTSFSITLPVVTREQLPEVSMDQFMIPLLENAVELLKRHFGVSMEIDSVENTHSNRISLSEITSFLNVRGIFEGTFVYSIDRDLAREQVKSYVLGEIDDEEVEQLIDDVVAECLNVIIGQSFKLFSNVEELIRMETPVTLHSSGSTLTYHTSEIWTAQLKSHVGEIKLSFVLLNDYS